MSAQRTALACLLSFVALWALGPARADAAGPETAWSLQSIAGPTNFQPGAEDEQRYEVFLTNIGAKASGGTEPITLTDTLPAGLEVKGLKWQRTGQNVNTEPSFCHTTPGGQAVVSCVVEGAEAVLQPGQQLRLVISLGVPASVSGPLENQVQASGAGGALVSATSRKQAAPGSAPKGFQEFSAAITGVDGEPVSSAASHPYLYTTAFAVNERPSPAGSLTPFVPVGGDLRDVEVALPPGLIGNPTAVTRCTAQEFNTLVGGIGNTSISACPDSSAVGVIGVRQLEGNGEAGVEPIYDLVPPPGMPAQLGFQVLGFPVYINFRLRSDGDYGVTGFIENTTEAKRVTAAMVMIWGVPGEASHDTMRGACAKVGGTCPFEEPVIRPFLRLPTSCANPLTTSMLFNTWIDPAFAGATASEPSPVGCESVDFSPTIEAKPTTNVADSPSGLNFDLHVPQAQHEGPAEQAEADLKDAVVTLAEEFVVNPSSADGLGACTEAQVGYRGVVEGRRAFTADPDQCPNAAKVGTVEVDTPLVDHPLPGAVYLAQPHENPFGSLIALYISVFDPQTGVVVKLPAEVELDQRTGRITTVVEANPQTPFEDFRFKFFEGARAPLRSPATCGTHTTTTALTPWSAPESGPAATPSDSFATTAAPGGGLCPTSPAAEPNSPRFEAGTASPLAGAYSPFTLRLGRADGSQELKGLTVALPPGLTGKLAGVAECPEASIAAAAAHAGRAEQASPSCPASSQVGTVTVGSGAGPSPYYVQGRAYLAGPYRGAPISLAIVTPAVAGPFDLGTVVVRTALQVNPETAAVTAVSDPLPTILQGIPLDVRSIAVQLDRNQFTLNPTSCEPMAFSGSDLTAFDQRTPLSARFQVGECNKLKLKPTLKLSLKGETRRSGHPALKAVLTYPKQGTYANIASAQVGLPHAEFLDQGNLNKVCTQPQLKSQSCPASSVYGHAKAWTPLLDKPLEGPVFLGVGFGYKLPALVAELNGQIRVLLVGKVDTTKHEGIRNTFQAVPDAPVSKFVLEMKGGKKYGLLENSENICRKEQRAAARFVGQNGTVSQQHPLIGNDCGKKGKGGKKGGGKGAGHRHKGRS